MNNKPKYERVKSITLARLFRVGMGLEKSGASGCFMTEFNRLIGFCQRRWGKVLFFSEITAAVEWAEQEPQWAKWWVVHGFLRRVEPPKPPERVFYAGQKFRCSGYEDMHSKEYILRLDDDGAMRLVENKPYIVHSWGISSQTRIRAVDGPGVTESVFMDTFRSTAWDGILGPVD